MFLDPNLRDHIVLASNYGLLHSYDKGKTWQPIILLTAPNTVPAESVAISSINKNLIIYSTSTTFNKSLDGGKTWITQNLETTRRPVFLIFNANDDRVIYMGVRK